MSTGGYTTEQIGDVIHACLKRARLQKYMGYDPADLLASRLRWILSLPASVQRILTIANFYSPVNVRRALGIEPQQNTTAMIVFGRVLLAQYRQTGDAGFASEAKRLAAWGSKTPVIS